MFIIKMAGLRIGIDHKYQYVREQCMDYIDISDEKRINKTENGECYQSIEDIDYAFCISVTDEEIKHEQDMAESFHSSGYCESICIYRKISAALLDYDGFLLHASIIEVDGEAYGFAAKSGIGKSTHTALWMEYFGERAQIINGDKPIIRYIDGRFIAYGTPWCGKEKLQVNTSSPVKAICFIERSETNTLRRISDSEIIDRIFHQILLPQNEQRTTQLFVILNELCRKIPFYVLQCDISKEAVITAYNGIHRLEEL